MVVNVQDFLPNGSSTTGPRTVSCSDIKKHDTSARITGCLDAKNGEIPMNVGTMSAPRLKGWLLLASLLVTVSAARLGQAQPPPVATVGNIQVCYNCSFDDNPVLDGPTFYINNTSASSITNAVLKIGPGGGFTDSFIVGTIAANS